MMLHIIGSRIHNRTSAASIVGTCAECSADVWLSPAQKAQIERLPTRIECGECCHAAGGYSVIAVTDASVVEYDRVLPNWRQLARERGMTVVNLDNPREVVDS